MVVEDVIWDKRDQTLDTTRLIRHDFRGRQLGTSADGLVNHYGKFVDQLSTTLAPLYKLLQKITQSGLGTPAEKAFKLARSKLMCS